MTRLRSPRDLEALRATCRAPGAGGRPWLSVCAGSGCTASGAQEVLQSLRGELGRGGFQDAVEVKSTGCHGFCEKGPVMVVWPEKLFYNGVGPRDAGAIVASVTNGGQPVERLLYKDPQTGARIAHEHEVPFYKRQQRILFANNGQIDPKDIGDYIRVGGYAALAKALTALSPDGVVEEIRKSGLRGRGGGGFPTGVKWRALSANPVRPHYLICNADEGDPGAFMDRSLLEGNPQSVIEGMIIGAHALGAAEGFIYVRAEYPLAVENLRAALAQAEEFGLLGEDILGSGLGFRIHVVQGAGAFVCGEETALIASIEGRAGQPHPRPPYPVQRGLWGKPTVINNVKTWASVPAIIGRGAEWYASIGTERSKGTMIFSLVGKVNNTGLAEVAMGITLREMIYEIGGGLPAGKTLKAIQIGGPSGGCIPASLIDLPIDYEALTEAGSMMGSGGIVVMDEDTCMVDLARYFMEFLVEESCGKCPPCRVGTKQLLTILERIRAGHGEPADLERLETLARSVQAGSLCGLGQTASNPVLTTLRYFRDEYVAHIVEHRCPAGVCPALVTYEINDLCNGCTLCARQCPVEAIVGEKGKPHVIDNRACIRCGACYDACNHDAIVVS